MARSTNTVPQTSTLNAQNEAVKQEEVEIDFRRDATPIHSEIEVGPGTSQ